MHKMLVIASFLASLAAGQIRPDWKAKLGSDPVYAATLDRYLAGVPAQIRQLPEPSKAPARDNWQPVADTCAALVNVYKLSGDNTYREQARQIATWLIRSNDYLVAHRDPALPYLGWGPETRTGYFQCQDVGGYHADDLWDTGSVLRCLLKVAEVEPEPLKSPYFQRAKQIVDAWPYVDHAPPDSAYGKAGLRWYRKSNEPCENRYVKNTNIEMGEQLFRMYRLTGSAADFERAVKTLYTQLWDVLIHANLAYTSYMTYVDNSAGYAAQVAHNERKVVHAKAPEGIGCGGKDASCWNHLGYEGYAMFNIQQLTRDIPAARFPVASTKDDIERTLKLMMDTWHGSKFGDAQAFDWSGKDSRTHVAAYNCALRFASHPVYEKQCRLALEHHPTSSTIFFALVPESLPGR